MKTAAASQQAREGHSPTAAVAARAAPAPPPKIMLAKEIPLGVAPLRASRAARFLKNGQSRVLRGRRPLGSVGMGQRPMKYMPAMRSAIPQTFAGFTGMP